MANRTQKQTKFQRKSKPKRTVSIPNCSHLCTTVIHYTAQNSSDNVPSYPPDNHHCSDVAYRRRGRGTSDDHRRETDATQQTCGTEGNESLAMTSQSADSDAVQRWKTNKDMIQEVVRRH